MPISPENQKLCDLLCSDIDKSSLGADEKVSLTAGLQASLESTNGLSPEEKLQSVAVTGFFNSSMIARIYLMTSKKAAPTDWKTVIIQCRNQILAAIIALAALLAYQPQMSSLLQALIGKM